jgi:thiaminase
MIKKTSEILLKNLYEKIQNDEITKYQFHQWLTTYAHKHWNKGMDEAEDIWENILKERASEGITMEDIKRGNYRLS